MVRIEHLFIIIRATTWGPRYNILPPVVALRLLYMPAQITQMMAFIQIMGIWRPCRSLEDHLKDLWKMKMCCWSGSRYLYNWMSNTITITKVPFYIFWSKCGQLWALTVILPLWGLSLTAPVQIMAQKRKVAHLVFERFHIVECNFL